MTHSVLNTARWIINRCGGSTRGRWPDAVRETQPLTLTMTKILLTRLISNRALFGSCRSHKHSFPSVCFSRPLIDFNDNREGIRAKTGCWIHPNIYMLTSVNLYWSPHLLLASHGMTAHNIVFIHQVFTDKHLQADRNKTHLKFLYEV